MSVAHARTTTKTTAMKTTAQYPLTISAAAPAGPAKAKTPVPLEEHWLESSAERAAKMTISPEMAAWVLAERHPRNRRLISGLVDRLAGALTRGEWAANGETIIFDRDGNLRNGQHRLTACVATGIPLVTWVVFGVDPAAFATMDRGGVRKLPDDLSIREEKNVHVLASVIAMAWREERGDVCNFSLHPSPAQAQDVLERNPALRGATDWVSARGMGTLLHPRLAAYCFWRFVALDAAAAVRFFEDLKSGAALEKGDPVLLLRNRLQDNKGAKAKLKAEEMLALAIKAWNYRRAGRRVATLRWIGQDTERYKAEAFPTIA